jgi:hypothetical protein
MPSQITVSGRVQHKEMDAQAIINLLRKAFPRLEPSDYDFVIPLNDCRAQFFCTSTRCLEFRIQPETSSGPDRARSSKAVTAIEILVRSTDTLWDGMRNALGIKPFSRRPTLDCVIEDTQSRTTLLVRESASPLRSPGAKVAYVISAIFCAATAFLILWQIHTRQPSKDRITNILTVLLSLGVAALTIPVPILVNWREWKKALNWRYVRAGRR